MKPYKLVLLSIALLAGCAAIKNQRPAADEFKDFSKNFTQASLPFNIEGRKYRPADYEAYYSNIFGYKSFIPELSVHSFGREVISNCSYVASVYRDSNYCALCYLVRDGLSDTMGVKRYVLATYNLRNSRMIDRLVFAGQSSPTRYANGNFGADGKINVTSYQITWKYKPEEKSYAENEVLKTDLVSRTEYTIDAKGRFRKMAVDNRLSRN